MQKNVFYHIDSNAKDDTVKRVIRPDQNGMRMSHMKDDVVEMV